MKSTTTIRAIAAAMILALLLIAACAPKASDAPAQPITAPGAEAAADVPEIAQAEQAMQDIGTSDLDEIDSDLSTIVLP